MPPKKEKEGGHPSTVHQRIIHGELDEFDIFIPAREQLGKLGVKHRAEHFVDNTILPFHIAMAMLSMRGTVFNCSAKQSPNLMPHCCTELWAAVR
jgi:hypothetical protein